MTDIQVLAPMKKGLLGVERLNRILQQYLNPPSVKKQEKEYGERLFRVGDKVMQTKIIISLSGRSQRNTVWLWTRASEFLMEILVS